MLLHPCITLSIFFHIWSKLAKVLKNLLDLTSEQDSLTLLLLAESSHCRADSSLEHNQECCLS